MKVCHINMSDIGSTGKIARDLLSIEGIDGKLFSAVKNTNFDNVVRLKTSMGLTAHRIIAGVFDCDNLGSKTATRKLIKQLKDFQPDIIHLHNLHGYYVNYTLLFKYIKDNNIKTVWTLHDCWPFTGHCSHFEFVKCDKWKSGCYRCSNLRQYPKSQFFDRSKQLYFTKMKCFTGVKDMTIVTPSKWLGTYAGQSFLSEYPIKVINNGINLVNFSAVDNRTFDNIIDRSKKIILGVASPFGARKGYNDFIQLNKIVDKSKFQIVMVGVTANQAEELSGHAIVPIQCTENQVQLAELYSLATIFLNATYEDNYPTVNLEALACGCPVITYKTGGSVEVIEDGNGYIVEKGDVKAVLDILNSHLDFNNQNISTKAKQLFDKATMCEKYYELYTEMLNEKN